MTTVDGVRAKLARALELLLQLDDQLHDYLDSDPFRLQQELTADGCTILVSFQVTSPPPLALSVFVGEVTHQLRSALDHLAYRLVQAAGQVPTSRTSFPILTSPPVSGLKVHGGVTPKALAAIEDLQPYQRQDSPNSHPLNILNQLWNIDKHRHLNVAMLRSKSTQAFIGRTDGSALVGGQLQTGGISAGSAIAAFSFPNTQPDDLEVTASGMTFLSLTDDGPWPKDQPMQELLEQLLQYVTQVVLPRLEPLLA